MKTNIKLFLIAALAMISIHGWGADETTYPVGIYYFEFIGFNSTSNQKVFGFNMFNNLTNYHEQSGDVVQLYSEGTCNANVTRDRHDYYHNKTSGVPMDVVAIDLSSPVSIQSDNDCLKLGVGESSATAWGTFNWKKYTDVGTPIAFSTGVYYLKITRTGDGTYTVAWQTSGSLPACANAGHTVTFAANNGSLGSITTAKQGESGSATDITSGSTLIKEDTNVRLVATPTGTNVFVGWKNSSDEYVSYDADYSFSMPDENVSLTAVFEAKRQVDGCANCFTVE